MAFFVREIAETNVGLREAIIQRLLDYFYQIRSGRVCVCALWIIGEYCTSPDEVRGWLDCGRKWGRGTEEAFAHPLRAGLFNSSFLNGSILNLSVSRWTGDISDPKCQFRFPTASPSPPAAA